MVFAAAQKKCVFPTPVGVFPIGQKQINQFHSLPHARGGVSPSMQGEWDLDKSSPRPWGCFWPCSCGQAWRLVFPTPVGVFPFGRPATGRRDRLPHARGGVSVPGAALGTPLASSPRPWGCFYHQRYFQDPYHVFPTPVGVFPSSTTGKNAKPDRGLQDAG